MKSDVFVKKLIDIATSYKTLYIMGCFGAPMNAKNKARYTKNNDYNKKHADIINAVSADTFGFDCVCLIKGVLWGWCGDVNKVYGGAVYESNGVPDVGADQMLNYCDGVSTNFSKIEVGEFLHMKGHCGIYIGNGEAVECTPKWDNKVQITAVGNIRKKKGFNTRTWNEHGRLQFIEYKTVDEVAHEVINGVWGNGIVRRERLTEAGFDWCAVQAKVEELLKPAITYKVMRGDTLRFIAKRYNTTVAEICRLNDISNPNYIFVGQVLRIRR